MAGQRTDGERPSVQERGDMLNSESDTCWAEGDANLSPFTEVRSGVCLYLLP